MGNNGPLSLFGDFGFVGGEDTAPNPLQDNQTCVNWYAEVNKQNAKEVVGLNACPGLVQLVAPLGGGVLGAPTSGSLALLHLDGTNGSTTFTDVYLNTWTGVSGATLSTTQAKFGPSSLGCSTIKKIRTVDQSKWAFTGDFTLEFFFYCNAVPGTFSAICSKIPNGSSSLWILVQFNTSSQIQTQVSVSAGTFGYNVHSGTISSGQWYHLAIVRSSGTITSYLNGVSFGTGSLSGTLSTDSTPISIGGDSVGILQSFDGFIDEIRIAARAYYTANFTPPAAPFNETPAPGTVTLSNNWGNGSTGFHFSSFTNMSFLTGFSGGIARGLKRPLSPNINSNDGNIYRVAISNGATQSNDVPNTFESSISSNGTGGIASFFKDPSNNNMALVMPHTVGSLGVFTSHIADTATGNIQTSPQQSTGTGANMYVCQYSTGNRIGDVLAVITKPPGITGTWRLVGAFPCADWQHMAVVTKDSGGTGNYWLHVVSVSALGTPVEVAFYLFTVPADGNDAASVTFTGGVPGSWVDPIFDRQANSMLESNLKTFWTSDGSGSGGTQQATRYFQVGSNSQVTEVANLFYSPQIGAGWSSVYADNGQFILYADNFAHSVVANVVQAAAPAWPTPSTILNLPVRALWELPNDNTALAVIGNTCYLVTLASPAMPTAFATLQLTSVGTLLTNQGPVHIRDNDVGGYAVIVDGPYGYLYNIATQVFTQITDPAFLGADTVAFIDGWWIFNQPGTQTFYTNGAQYSTGFNASFFALKDGAPDNLRAVFENKEQLWLLGDKTTEVWYDAGGQYFAFQRLVGTLMQFGCKAPHSVSRFSTEGQDGVILFGRSERGENVIIKTRGFSFDVVSTPAFSKEVAQYPITSDAIAYTYQEDTHEFYVLIFPTADTTWCYDAQSGLLHKRLSYDPYLQKFHRHRSNAFMNFQGMRIVGDYQNGALYQLTRNVQTDAGWPLRGLRRSPHIWDKGQRGRVFMASLQADFRPGVGNASGLGSNPQANLRISRDGGATYGQTWPSPIGQIGQYKTRTMWRKLAFARDSVVELEVIDPVPRDIIGVTLRAFSA